MAASPLRGEFAHLGAALAAAAEQFGEQDAYVDTETRLTFAAWDRAADAVASELSRRGCEPGDVVAIGLPSSAAFAIAYVAVLRIGAIVTAVNTRLGPLEVRGILRASGARLLIGDLETHATIPILSASDLARLISEPPSGVDVHPQIDRDDAAVIIWTSGTTGTPKGAWFRHAELAAASRASGVMSEPFDRRLVATPFAHAGYMAKVWDQIAWGIAFIVPPIPWSAPTTAALLRAERVTVASLVPTQWSKMLEHEGGERPFTELRLGTAATAPAPPSLVEEVKRRFRVPLVVRYAMTESPSITGTDPDESASIQSRTVGRAQPGMEVRVVDGHGAELPSGEVGDIEARGACIMRGYWGDEEATSRALSEDGWLRTGDVGRLSPHGHLSLTGRRGDMYIRGGYNVYPLEVERVLTAHPLVDQVAVVGTPAPVIGEVGVAFVVPTADRVPTLEELRDHVRSELADYKAPDRLVVLEALPLTPMMKIDRIALRRLERSVTQPRPSAPSRASAPRNA